MEDDSDDDVYGLDTSSEQEDVEEAEEDVSTLSISRHLVPKLTTRKRNRCEAKWISRGKFAGMAEVVRFKGNYLRSTGIVRDSQVLLHVEEIGYLMQKEALTIHNGDCPMTIMDVYTHIMTGEHGCSWDAFKVYLELKTLGYIVGRHGILWSKSSSNSDIRGDSYKKSGDGVSSGFEKLQIMDQRCHSHGKNYAEAHASSLLEFITTVDCALPLHDDKENVDHIHSPVSYSELLSRNVEVMFDVFPPNSKFKKRNPGTPDFSLCVSSDLPPNCASMEALKSLSGNIPVTIASVDSAIYWRQLA